MSSVLHRGGLKHTAHTTSFVREMTTLSNLRVYDKRGHGRGGLQTPGKRA